MSPEQTSDSGGAGVLATLLAPLRLPERALEALESLAEAVRHLGPMRSELTGVREQTQSLPDLMPAVECLLEQTESLPDVMPAVERLEKRITTRLDSLHEVVVGVEGSDSHLNKAVGELHREVASMHSTLTGLQDDVQSVTDRLPDPTRGPLEKARDALTGSGDQEQS